MRRILGGHGVAARRGGLGANEEGVYLPPEVARAVVLLSGGMDSATTLAIAVRECAACHALSFRYGQRHQVELKCAAKIARALGAADHRIVDLPIAQLGGSALTDRREAVPQGRSEEELARGIPSTYVPARNTIFLAYALGYAETTGSDAIYIGANCVDYSGYPDCRPEFMEAFQRMANLATKRAFEGHPVQIRAPLLTMSKAQIIRQGLELGVDFSLTHSCYDPDEAGRACGRCDSCRLRLRAFAQLGMADPAPYASRRCDSEVPRRRKSEGKGRWRS